MARKWQKVAALGRRISSPRADECSDFDACSTSSVLEEGHFFVYSSEGKRFMVPLAYLDNDIFKELLKTSEEEFGLPSDGPITMPCDTHTVATALAAKATTTFIHQALILIEISEMAKKWQKVASFKRMISSPKADERADFNACSTSSVAEKGHFNVYTLEGKRFMVPLAYLDNKIFKELLKISEEEFGLPGDGPITLPCDAASMEYVLSMLRRGISQEVERALLSSIFISCQSSCSTLIVDHTQQLATVGEKVLSKLRMARKWQIVTALGRRRISPVKTDASSDSEACTTATSVAHKGHFIVYTSDGKRFMVPLEYLDNKIFHELFRMSEEEYGLPGDGPIKLHFDAVFMDYILLLLKKQVSKDVERAFLGSILVSHQSSYSSIVLAHKQQPSVCSF
ncbi:hypothetical protein J5N97_029142 [Dioscorea zingiberensis]|uniref:Uncharacterized protein n=1 Tax=Dioscorea zingiberensis TaxID=325984 RepID=A0A9D5H5L9_9LILI|nr:hypothetical protein J5N97_029142 [Dioscorea zingiberensis]